MLTFFGWPLFIILLSNPAMSCRSHNISAAVFFCWVFQRKLVHWNQTKTLFYFTRNVRLVSKPEWKERVGPFQRTACNKFWVFSTPTFKWRFAQRARSKTYLVTLFHSRSSGSVLFNLMGILVLLIRWLGFDHFDQNGSVFICVHETRQQVMDWSCQEQ